MDWGTLWGTGLGAVMGVGSTLLADRIRWKRDQSTRLFDLRRQLYGDYLSALTRTRNELKHIGSSIDLDADERARHAGAAYREGGVPELRYQIAILAPQRVVGPAVEAHRRLRAVGSVGKPGACTSA
ncbi:hypothetical protein GCM10010503_31130 [Streptomyces lucensis JCM 4490]|uniref:Uncharacterized protein n=1 Tax=Streptomyces lucensis JCM 4490 TaxID=1306176 RepID=A0A918J8U3_9ACTN|nr:hypothetical protein GCM10010503_31130 [Streptomyces lucensis JCM 4490]